MVTYETKNESEVVDDNLIEHAVISFDFGGGLGVDLAAQYDCGNSWVYYNLGGDGDSIEETIEEYFCNVDMERSEIEALLYKALSESKPEPESFADLCTRVLGCEVLALDNLLLNGYYNNTSVCVYESIENQEIFVGIWESFEINKNYKKFASYAEYKKWLYSDEIWGGAADASDFRISHRIDLVINPPEV